MARLPTLVGSLVGWMEQIQKATFKQSTVRFASLEHELTKDPMAARILHQDHPWPTEYPTEQMLLC